MHEPPLSTQSSPKPIEIFLYIIRMPFLRNIFVACFGVALLVALYHWLYLSPSYRQMTTAFCEEDAQRLALYVMRTLNINKDTLSEKAIMTTDKEWLASVQSDFDVEEIRLFDSQDTVVFSTTTAEIGAVNTRSYAKDLLIKGRSYSRLVTKEIRTQEGRLAARDLAHVYVPIREDKRFLGVLEIYYDITASKSHLNALLWRSDLIIGLIVVTMMIVVMVVLFKTGAAMIAHSEMDEAIHEAHDLLDQKVRERTKDLILANKDLQLEIMERRTAESNLRDSEKRFRTLIETIPYGIQEIGTDGKITFANPAHERIYECDPKVLIGTSIFELAADEHERQRFKAHMTDLVDHQPPPLSWYGRHRTKEGREIDTKVDWNYKLDVQGRLLGLIAVISDITHRKKAEKALKESKELFDAFMRHLPGLAFMKDPQGQYLYVNDIFTRLTATKTWDIIGKKAEHIWDNRTAKTINDNDKQMFQDLSAINNMEDVRLPDGRRRHLLTARFPIFQDESLFALGGISIDVTERTIAQNQKRKLELQLQQTQKMEALGTLAGGIAHDFNNILASVIGYTEIAITETEESTTVNNYLKRVLESGERARSLVKQILAFSRQGDMEPKPVRVKLIVKEVLKLLRASLPATIDIVQEINTDRAVMADPTQLHQVMMNLCTNSGYAMSQKGGELEVRLQETILDGVEGKYGEVLSGDYLKLTVEDTGEGIRPEHLGKIFDPFFTTKPKGEGTGMGLAVVHGIVTGLGGTINVVSTFGEGTRFEVLLPALPKEIQVVAAEKKALPVGNEHLLIVDDEKFQTDMLKHMLQLLGYKVDTRNSGPEALALFKDDPKAIDLVITDMIMPEMTGDTMAQKMIEIRPGLPVILVTGYSKELNEAKAKELGMSAFASKPLVMEELSRLIRQVLDE